VSRTSTASSSLPLSLERRRVEGGWLSSRASSYPLGRSELPHFGATRRSRPAGGADGEESWSVRPNCRLVACGVPLPRSLERGVERGRDRVTGPRLVDSRRVEASRDGHSDGGHGLLPADIFSSTVQLGAPRSFRGVIGEWSRRSPGLSYFLPCSLRASSSSALSAVRPLGLLARLARVWAAPGLQPGSQEHGKGLDRHPALCGRHLHKQWRQPPDRTRSWPAATRAAPVPSATSSANTCARSAVRRVPRHVPAVRLDSATALLWPGLAGAERA
jgi:hypothetical protein